MNRLSLFILLCLLSGCGEITSQWEINWQFKSKEILDTNTLSYNFKVNYKGESDNYIGSFADTMYLIEFFIISYTVNEVNSIKPEVNFTLLNNNKVIIDTLFTWEEMGFGWGYSQTAKDSVFQLSIKEFNLDSL